MLNEQECQFQNDRPYPGDTQTFGISAETDRELWDLLQRPEDRKTEPRTYLPDEMPASEVQRIFGSLPSPDAVPQSWTAIEADDESTEPLNAERTYQVPAHVLNALELAIHKLRRDLAAHQEYSDLQVETERMERQGQLDSLEDRFDDLLSTSHRDMSELERQIDQSNLETNIQLRLDQQDWERQLATLKNRLDGLDELRSSRCSAAAGFLRVAAVMVLGFSVASFVTAGFSGSPQQKDNFAQAGGLAVILGIGAAAIGCALD